MDTLDTVHLPIGPTALSASGLLGPDSEIIASEVEAELLTEAGFPISTEEMAERFAGLTRGVLRHEERPDARVVVVVLRRHRAAPGARASDDARAPNDALRAVVAGVHGARERQPADLQRHAARDDGVVHEVDVRVPRADLRHREQAPGSSDAAERENGVRHSDLARAWY